MTKRQPIVKEVNNKIKLHESVWKVLTENGEPKGFLQKSKDGTLFFWAITKNNKYPLVWELKPEDAYTEDITNEDLKDILRGFVGDKNG